MSDTLLQRLEEGIAQIAAFAPALGWGLGLLLAGFVIAKLVERGTELALRRVGFDRLMRDGGVSEALERTGTRLDPSTVIAKLIFWTVMLLVILVVANALGLTVVSGLFAELLSYIPNVFAAVIILLIGLILGEFVKDVVLASAGAVRGGAALARAAKAAVVVLTIFMALEQLDIAADILLVTFIAAVGAVALALGLSFGLGGREVAGEVIREWYRQSRAWEAAAAEARAARQDEPYDPDAPDSMEPGPDPTGDDAGGTPSPDLPPHGPGSPPGDVRR
jgi:hypothetical protein